MHWLRSFTVFRSLVTAVAGGSQAPSRDSWVMVSDSVIFHHFSTFTWDVCIS